MRLALAQMAPVIADPGRVLVRIAALAEKAAADGADCLITPELVIHGYGAGARFADLAEPLDGPSVARLREIAAKTGLTIVAGLAERDGDDIYNAAVAVGPDGLGASYRKLHLYGPYERTSFKPGDALPPVFEVAGLKAGLLICYDVEFPEAVRYLADAGAKLVLVPTALPAGDQECPVAETLIRARAFENQVFVAYADLSGRDGAFVYAGRSVIAAPDGSDLARAGAESDGVGEALLVADIRPEDFDVMAAEVPYLCDLRRDMFGPRGAPRPS